MDNKEKMQWSKECENIDLTIQTKIFSEEENPENAKIKLRKIKNIIDKILRANDKFSYDETVSLKKQVEVNVKPCSNDTSEINIKIHNNVLMQEEFLKEIEQIINVNDSTSNNIIKQEEKNNVLIISEKKGKVYLPFLEEDIDKLLRSKKFKTKQEIIDKLYTVPLSKYLNPVTSRVREAFKLMREREHVSVIESLKYAYNFAFERRLHPAIITACKTMDDLDIYMACLENDVLALFDSFKVIFDYNPAKVEQNVTAKYSADF